MNWNEYLKGITTTSSEYEQAKNVELHMKIGLINECITRLQRKIDKRDDEAVLEGLEWAIMELTHYQAIIKEKYNQY